MLTANGQVAGIMVTGIEPSYEKKVSIIHEHMTSGSIDTLKAGDFDIVLGKQMAESLGGTGGRYGHVGVTGRHRHLQG